MRATVLWSALAVGLIGSMASTALPDEFLQRVATLKAHRGWIYDLAWSPAGTVLFSASADDTVIQWRVPLRGSAQVIGRWWAGQGSMFAVVCLDQERFVTGDRNDRVILWNTRRRSSRVLGRHGSDVEAIVATPDGTTVFSAGRDRIVMRWSLREEVISMRFVGHVRAVVDLALSPNGRWLASAGEDGQVIVWDTQTGQPRATHLLADAQARAVRFLSSDWIAIGDSTGTLVLWRWTTPAASTRLLAHKGWVHALDVWWGPKTTWLATGGGDGRVRIGRWDGTAFGWVDETVAHRRSVLAVAFAPDGRLATGGMDEVIHVWQIRENASNPNRFQSQPLPIPTASNPNRFQSNRRGSMTDAWGVLFDLDGVLIDSARWHLASWQWLAQQYGRLFPETFFRETFGMPNQAILRRLFADRSLTEEEIESMSHQKETKYRELVRSHLTWAPGAQALLEDLVRAGARLGLFTSTPRSNIDFLDSILGFSRYISVILTSDDVPQGKPAPDGYRALCERLNLQPNRAVVIEDAPAGIEAAHRAGIRCIAVATTHPRERLQTADWVVGGLIELTADRLRTWLEALETIRGNEP